jgi:hypothetical protein
MSVESILAPLFVLVALTFFLLFYMGAVRFGALRRREVRIGDIALGQSNWPAYAAQGGNSYNNQFQLPVLFYVLVILAYIFKKADLLFVIMSWIFVVSRILHAYVHATSNNMRMRFTIFVVGAVVLMIMWIIFAVRMLLAIG